MRVVDMLDRCHALECGAAAMYRRFAAQSPPGDELGAVWARLATEEDGHAAAVERARAALATAPDRRVDGWTETVEEAERVLRDAEARGAPSRDDCLALALDLERTEIDALRRLLVSLAGVPDAPAPQADEHATALAEVAARSSQDARVQVRASLIHARRRLAAGGRVGRLR